MQAKIWKDKVSFLVSVLLLQEYVANYFLAEISVTLNYKKFVTAQQEKLLIHRKKRTSCKMSLLLEISIQDMTCVSFSFRSILTFLDEVEKAEDDAISEISQVGK